MTTNATKLPSFQFYPGDWLKDANLRSCSIFARGMFIDLVCALHDLPSRGRFVFADSTPWRSIDIVAIVTGPESNKRKLSGLEELIRKGVLKRDSQGIVYSSRMVRDEELRQKRADAGSKGGKVAQAKSQANRQAKSSASSSSSSSPSGKSDLNGHSSQSATSKAHPPSKGDKSDLGNLGACEDVTESEFAERCLAVTKRVRLPVRETPRRDARRLIARAVILSFRDRSEHWLMSAAEGVAHAGPDDPCGYFAATLADSSGVSAKEFTAELKSIRVPKRLYAAWEVAAGEVSR